MDLRLRSRAFVKCAVGLALAMCGLPVLAGEGEKTPERSAKDFVFGGLNTLAEAAAVTPEVRSAAFSPEIFLSHVYYLASDELGGRGVGTVGIDRAADYIAAQFASVGIEPGGVDGTYFQPFEMGAGVELNDEGYLEISGSSVDKLKVKRQYNPFVWSTNDACEGEVVFVGYGLVNADKNYDDYAGIDVTGKVAMMFRREPPGWGTGTGRQRFSRLAQFNNKVKEAKDRGAVGVIIVNQEPEDGESDSLVPFFGRGGGNYGLPAFHVTREIGDEILSGAGLPSLSELQAKLDAETPTQCSAKVGDVRVRGLAGLERKTTNVKNVIGLIRGEGPLADEYVVIGGHYDHMGTVAPRSMFGSSDAQAEIHNGADDNASGTAGVIEIGKALKQRGSLKRSVLLFGFTAEESGLLGSAHYVSDPTVPLENIVACINMDMIGRVVEDSHALEVYGVGTAEEFEPVLDRSAGSLGLVLNKKQASSGRSDEASFLRHNIPGVHFFSGEHADYHRHTDDTEKVNEQDAVRVLQLVYDLTTHVIDAPRRPTYRQIRGFASIGGGPSGGGNRVIMGIMPDVVADDASAGLPISSVSPGGPAETAGMKDGDAIIRIAETKIDQIDDYARALRDKKAGDEVEVTVTRDGKEVVLQVKLAAG